MKPGTRLRSAACDCEVVVVRAPADGPLLQCGGVDMLEAGQQRPAGLTPLPGLDGGSLLGKRYSDATGAVEVLCTKAGSGTLAHLDQALEQRAARPLPASD